ncbi:hypothetical protein PHYSODRAFT_524442 [Phytophthora sojae]|uniref:M96 mating-specific protein family n=1 Tax=Phytophthora sojae (strain P6497) TaxID=1094619 RepID=G5A6F9_PHYSP|nr:hypothetical protein PHYSODRAFT_524442 [Phytophthora sojae]EGZ08914.1 hypothetical protein PHYSODRAFT_524442 [Phytophthora sojae]|eukprot:XP_009535547.1 hypothetical protein PHYSODRAFT_524442 [Phytophthora sojae]
MEGDMPTDFLQDLDLWLSQDTTASPAINTHTLDLAASNAGLSSLEAALLAPGAPQTDAATTDSLAAALTDESLPWTALTESHPIAKAAEMLSVPIPTAPTTQSAVEAPKPKRPRKGRPPAAASKASGVEPPQKKAKTNKSTSQRQKEELAYLREKSEQLEVELTSLKQRNREELERQQREQEQKELSGVGGEMPTAMVTRRLNEFGAPAQPEVSLWERIAKRQREEKAKAELENVKLREMVQSQMRLVKSFERLLRKRKIWDQLQENSSSQEGGEARKEEEVLEEMVRDVDARYPQVDKVLSEHGLGASDPAVDVKDGANMKYSPTDGMYLEYKEKKYMPFDYTVLDEVVWRSFGEGKLKLEDSQLTIIKNTDEMLFSRTIMPLTRKGSSDKKDLGNSVNLSVMKRFTETQRIVYVWHASTSVKNPQDGTRSPVLLVQKGYAIMEAATLPDGSPGSVVRSYTNSVPTLSSRPSEGDMEQQQEQNREAGLLTEMVFAAYQQSRQSINQTLENLLLDEMMARNATVTPATSGADTDISL